MGDKVTALYVRVSTEEQAKKGFSVDAQKEKLIKACHEKKWFYELYEDAGYSAGNLKRPAIQRLIKHIKEGKKEGKISRVLVWRLDRLSRKMSDLYRLISLFESHGVDLVSLTENISTNLPIGKLLTGILGSVAEFERESIRERIKAVKETRKKVKRLPLGHNCFGYDKNWKIIEKQAEVVREIFSLVKQYPCVRIVWLLNSRGIRTRDGNLWSKTTVHDILTRPIYAGLLKMDDGSYIKAKVEPIISESDFFEVQKILKQRRRENKMDGKYKHLLSGILKCGYCGTGVCVTGDYKAGKAFYICGNKIARGTLSCKGKRHKKEYVERIFLKVLIEEIQGLDREKLRKRLKEKLKDADYKKLFDEKKKLERELGQIEKRIEKLYILFEEEDIDLEVLKKRLESLKQQKNNVQNQLKSVQFKLKTVDPETLITRIDKILDEFEKIWDQADHDTKRSLILKVIEKAEVFQEKIVLRFIWGTEKVIEFPQKKLLELSQEEIKELEKVDKIHAKVVLLAGQGWKAKEIAAELGIDFSKVVWIIGNYRKNGMKYIKRAKKLRENQKIPQEVINLIEDFISKDKERFRVIMGLSEIKKFLEEHGIKIAYNMLKNVVYKYQKNDQLPLP